MVSRRHGKCIFLGTFLLQCLEATYAESYKAVVVSYKPDNTASLLPSEIEEANKNHYVSYIADVASRADIIVFPEHGITTVKPNTLVKSYLDAYSIHVPEPETENFKDTILDAISSAAKSSQIYVVINVLEKSNSTDNSMKFYSTNVVFDQSGKMIAKCRKKHLFREDHYDKGEANQKCTFDAKFKGKSNSIKFALLFDTDILFKIPQGIENVILTSSLPNQLPLLFGLSLQAGFSVTNNVNLLVSGYTETNRGYGGTGVYLRDGKSNVTVGSRDLLAIEVPLNKNANLQKIEVNVNPTSSSDPLQGVDFQSLPTLSNTNITISQDFNKDGSSYCRLSLDSNGNNNIEPYRWVVLSNTTNILGQGKRVIICGMIKPEPSRNQQKIVNGVTVELAEKTDSIIQALPLSLGSNMIPADFVFERVENNGILTIKMTLKNPGDLSGFGFLLVINDNEPSHGTRMYVTFTSLTSILPLFLILWSKIML